MSCNKIKEFTSEGIGESYVRVEHKSGLTVFVSKKPFSTSYAVFGTRYGSCDNVFKLKDDADFCAVPEGIAHFLEHKMFESEDGHDSFEDFAEAGADANAYTSTDRTAYLFSCTDGFYKSLEVLLKMVTTPVFTGANVKKEQGIIGQEIRMCLDRPSNALYYNLMKAMYGDDPVSIQIAGTVESIAEITPELLYKCYDVFYRMSNMALCTAGNVDVDKIMEIVDRVIPTAPTAEIIGKPVVKTQECSQQSISARMEVAKPLFRIGIKDADGTPKNGAVASVLAEAVFGESSDFYTSAYEDGLISSYSSYAEYSRTACYVTVGGDTDDPETVFKRFCDHAERMVENGIPYEDFERAKRVLYADTMKGFDSSESIAEAMLDAFLVSDDFLGQAEAVASVTYDEMTALAKRLLKKEKFAMSTVYPKSSGADKEGKGE